MFSQAVRSHNMTEAIKPLWCALGHHIQTTQQELEIKQLKSKKTKPSKSKSEWYLNANFKAAFNSFSRFFQKIFSITFSMKKYQALQFCCEDSYLHFTDTNRKLWNNAWMALMTRRTWNLYLDYKAKASPVLKVSLWFGVGWVV